MSRTVSIRERRDGEGGDQDWDALFPPDPDLMASAEGDAKGLAELQQAARWRIERLNRA